ncbi:MAG: ribose-phosphate pyrophosphokinase [Rhodospirillales bacterium]|nr:MAG: ribose-phosphate pyrophosphokinase [Rhodospirillales bacterium]
MTSSTRPSAAPRTAASVVTAGAGQSRPSPRRAGSPAPTATASTRSRDRRCGLDLGHGQDGPFPALLPAERGLAVGGQDLALFALHATRPFGERVAGALGVALAAHEEREFEDGEHKARPRESVRGRDAFVVQSLHGDAEQSVNDKLVRLLLFIGALKDASADRVTAIVPYLGYARKDRKTKTRDPVATRYVAQLLEAVGVDRVVTIDVHNLAAFQNSFRCPTDHLEAAGLFVDHFRPILDGEIAVVSPDAGGVKRADRFRTLLARATGKEIGGAFMEKYRSRGIVSGAAFVGDVAGRTAIVIDDLISTGGTMTRAARACRENGATAVHAVATHGLFTGDAAAMVADPAFDGIVVTDTVPPFRLPAELVERRLVVLDAATLFAEAIGRIHAGGSLVALMGDADD